ncbi:MAG: Serine O-acetyltransferase, partial [Verrucomicrobiales bacterium]|nr:Serine O-acetyltransferase [Verrucomicrobiales bacterium]
MSLTVTDLTNQLIASYAKVGGINHLDGKNLPSKTRIGGVTADLLRLLFPGFFDEHVIHSSELKVEIATLMDEVCDRLENEIYRGLDYAPPEGVPKKDLHKLGRKLTLDFLARLPHVRDLLHTDVEAAFRGDPAAL